MIYKNFSNYSAWHRRSVLVERLTSQGLSSAEIEKIINDDLKLLKSAYFTEPADQSAWFYLRWLLDFAVQHNIKYACELVKGELSNIDELLVIEPDAPLALYTWAQLARKMLMRKGQSEGKDGDDDEEKEKDGIKDKLRERLQRLCLLDPMRAKMYQSMMI